MSLTAGQPILGMIEGRLLNTVFLASVAALISVPLAILLGLVAARFRDTWIDKSISIATLSTISMPEFFVGYILIFLFAVTFRWAPSLANIYDGMRSEEHTSELQSLMRISYAVFCLKKKNNRIKRHTNNN